MAKAGVTKAERRVEVAQRRAKARATTQRLKMEIVGHTEDPEAVAATGGKQRNAPSQPPFTSNEKARLVHCVACPEFRSCVELMLRG